MPDLFELKSVNAFLKIPKLGDVELKFCDPNFKTKVVLRKKYAALNAQRDELSTEEYLERVYELNCEQVKMYLPEITAEQLDLLGDFDMNALMNQLLEMTSSSFGAVVEKIEKK